MLRKTERMVVMVCDYVEDQRIWHVDLFESDVLKQYS